ncbi:hypothetical protein [Nocardia thraciensis]
MNDDPDEGDTWDDLPPFEQGREAEGVKAVVEELERRGWRPVFVRPWGELVISQPGQEDQRLPVRNAADLRPWSIPAPDAESPRKWEELRDVPVGVPVRDSAGDRWEYRNVGLGSQWGPILGGVWNDDFAKDHDYGPFVEIIEG